MAERPPTESILYATVLMETTDPDGSIGRGTGFFFTPVENEAASTLDLDDEAVYLVTNRHVIEGAASLTIQLNATDHDGNPTAENAVEIVVTDSMDRWVFHPDERIDVAVASLEHLSGGWNEEAPTPFISVISADVIPKEEDLEALSYVSQVVFFGFPIGLRDTLTLFPLARPGITATPPHLDYRGLPHFLIDASVFPGSSGSPVLVIEEGAFTHRRGGMVVGGRILFLGLVSAGFRHESDGTIVALPIPTQVGRLALTTYELIDLGIVVKARTILEVIDSMSAADPPKADS